MTDKIEIRYLSSKNILGLYYMIYPEDVYHRCLRLDILETILNDIQDDDKHPKFVDKLTYLFCGILQNHPFTDGNKNMAVQSGALFLYANGYNAIMDRYQIELYRLMPSIARGLIGQELIRDILNSILDGNSYFDESLQLRILFAIDDFFVTQVDWGEYENPFWFEKQIKLYKFTDNPRSLDKKCQHYPCLKLVFNDDWNDFGYRTWFSLWLVSTPDNIECLGNVKITDSSGLPFDKMHWNFSRLSDDFCSLGIDTNYYQKILNIFGKQVAKQLLAALRDSAIDNSIFEQFCNTPPFKSSLLRDISSEKALKEAPFIIENRKKSEAYSFSYDFIPDPKKPDCHTSWNVPIDYDALPYKRTYAIIGDNAVGKTTLLSNLVFDLASKNTPHFTSQPLLSGILVICSSHFDAYYKKQPAESRIPLQICSVVQSNDTFDILTSAIDIIKNRGTIYNGNSPISIREKYCHLIDDAIYKDFSSQLFIESFNDSGNKEVLINSTALQSFIEQISTGQLQIFSLITYVCAYLHLNSLIIVDEPEIHLHPALISRFFRILNKLLSEFSCYAFVATHSPLVIRECVDSNVYMMLRSDDNEPTIKPVPFKTFGEDLTTLYENVFGFKESNTLFHKTIEDMLDGPMNNYDSIVTALHGQGIHLSMNALNTIASCLNKR